MKVAEVMTRDVVTATTTTPYKDLVLTMLERGITGVPVLDEHRRLVGIVTEADLLDRSAYPVRERSVVGLLHRALSGPGAVALRKAAALTASGLMTEHPVTASPDETIASAARRMLELKLKRLPVVDAGSRLVGIVSRRDLLRGYARSDREIAAAVQAMLQDPRYVPEEIALDRLTVRDGVVEVRGSVNYPGDESAVAAALGGVPGVVAVETRLRSRNEPAPLPSRREG
jgi:CBS domain-containing protein